MKVGQVAVLENSQCERFEVEYIGKGRYLVKNATAFVGGSKIMSSSISKIRKWVMSCP